MEEKLNLEGIDIDMNELINKYNGKMGSVSDPEEIRQISLFCIQNDEYIYKEVLMDMINPGFSFCGLYPSIIKTYDIKPI